MLFLSITGALLEQVLWLQLYLLNFANGYKHPQLSNSYTLDSQITLILFSGVSFGNNSLKYTHPLESITRSLLVILYNEIL